MSSDSLSYPPSKSQSVISYRRILKLFRNQKSRSRTRVLPITLTLVLLLIALPSLHIPVAHAANYTPGVAMGEYVDYGQFTFQGNGNSFNVQTFIHVVDLRSTVTNVNGNTVTLSQTATFDNGTAPRSVVLQGDVATGTGNLTFALIAGRLTAGDAVTQAPPTQGFAGFASAINETVARNYAGAVRTINVGIQEPSLPGVSFRSAVYWDAQTGFALELSLTSFIPAGILSPSSPSSSITIHLKATSTNIWTPSTNPDFGLDITPLSSFVLYQGSSDTFSVNVTSFGMFYGTVNLQTQLSQTNSSVVNAPLPSIMPPSLYLGPSQSSQSSLGINATTHTPLGLYLFTVNATSGSLRHDAILAIEVVPPDFALLPTGIILTVAQGTTASTTMMVKSLGAFSGTVLMSPLVFQPGLQVSLNTTSVVLSPGRTVNLQLNATAAPTLASTTYFGEVTGSSGSQSHISYLIIDVVHLSAPVITIISVSPSPANTGASITLNFGVYSLATVTGVAVNWGDGTTTDNLVATARTNTHVYATTGNAKSQTFKITINATNIAGIGTSTYLEAVTDRLPTISITSVTPTSVYVGQTFTLNFAAADADGTVASASVDWGDGTNTALAGTATQATHSYTSSGTFTIKATITDNSGNTASATYAMTIPAPDFSVSATSPSSTTTGQSATSTITITAHAGFTGTINLSVTTQPSGPTCTSTPTSITQSQTATVSCSSTTSGTYTMTVTGTSGSTTHLSTFSTTFNEPASPASPQPNTILGLAPVIFYGIIGAIIVVVIAGVTVAIRRKSP
jgi:hypothetical protein